MLLRSNIKTVIGRLERLEADLPGAVQRALDPKHWEGVLVLVADKELKAIWVKERSLALHVFWEKVMPMLIASITGGRTPEGVRFSMTFPRGGITPPTDLGAAADFNLGQRTPSGRIKKEIIEQQVFDPASADKPSEENLQRVRQVILDWVTMEKDLDPERDYDKDGSPLPPEELARRIENILGIGTDAVPRARDAAMQAAAKSLTVAIQGWLAHEVEHTHQSPAPKYAAGETGPAPISDVTMKPVEPQTTIGAEQVAQWLTIVLLAWRTRVLQGLPNRLSRELRKVFAKGHVL